MTKIEFNLRISLDYFDDLETLYHTVFKENTESKLSFSRQIFDVGDEVAIITLYTEDNVATIREFCLNLCNAFSVRWQQVDWSLE